MGRAVAYVDSLAASSRATATRPDARLVTDNPVLASDPRTCGRIADVSTHLDQPLATRTGRAAIDHLLALDRALDDAGAAERFGGYRTRLNLTLALRALWASMIHRGAMMAAFMRDAQADHLRLLVVDAPRWEPGHPWIFPRFACPFRPLAEAGFFGPIPVETEIVHADLPADPASSTTDDTLSRILLVPFPMLGYEALRRCGLTRLAARRSIAIGKPSEALRETLPWLLLRGYRLDPFAVPQYAGPPPPAWDQIPGVDPWIAAIVQPLLARGLADLGLFDDAQRTAMVTVALRHITAGLMSLGPTRAELDARLDRAFSSKRNNRTGGLRALVTSGVYGPMGGQLHAACLSRNIRLIDFEHGATTGIAHGSERRIEVSEATTCDWMLVSSERAARSFARAGGGGPRIVVAGLPDQTRKVLRRPLQRWRARRRLGLPRPGRTVVHVSTLLYGGNMRPGDDSPVERYVFETERVLLTKAYADIECTVLYKPYPTQRHVHDTTLASLHGLPGNVRIAAREDFRYLRAAADIIVTEANSSTLGWCVGAGVPLIHLGSIHVNALVDDRLRQAFAQSFFAIDMDRPDWPKALGALIRRPMSDLMAEWRDKSAARGALLRDGIVGPNGIMGRRAAREIVRALA